MKCDDLHCCSSKRGTYCNIFPHFIPAPICLDPNTLIASDNLDLSNKFTSLLLRLRIDDSNFRNQRSGEVPFDLCCPSVKELIKTRTCVRCGVYFASVKSVKSHKRICRDPHPALNETFGQQLLMQRRNIRPVRVAATRQHEKMIILTSRINDEHADWFDDDELANIEIEDVPVSSDETERNETVFDLATHMNVPWENDV